ncbi:hypothetical protein [Bartonella henselae]|uniref:Uncharacterized protein n=2 Tax=Bartonella henselae TaxID=38323 RepID=X5M7S8_BARHN|nr:hypothetical protein [Bartonella henselae]ETS15185.1 hypothetical protein Q652_00228 [Bartonella henselae JK 41]ETS11179.1 hypothetical protein Q653_00095 [Bartonella henselae JK 42]KEC59919.1 hypothetical protein O95_00976 [Bartonella henselae JK 53]UJM43913.1 hypothetical protein KAE73_01425 [Bartonella henselae]CDO47013.1 hypothetical protein BM1374165_01010 [Bartonella henselae]
MKNVLSILITIIFIISQVVNVNAGFWNGAPQDSKTAFFIQQQNNAITQQYKGQFIQAVNIPFMLTPEASIGKETDLFSEGKVENVFIITSTILTAGVFGAFLGSIFTTMLMFLGGTFYKWAQEEDARKKKNR